MQCGGINLLMIENHAPKAIRLRLLHRPHVALGILVVAEVKKIRWSSPLQAAGSVAAYRRPTLTAVKVFFRRAARSLELGEAGSSLLIKCAVYTLRIDMAAWCYGNLSLDGARQHFETLHGIGPGFIIVRVAPFRRPLGTFHPQLHQHRGIVTAKQNIESTHCFS